MENVKSENRIFGSYKPRTALMLIFAIAILICTLAPAFFEVPSIRCRRTHLYDRA